MRASKNKEHISGAERIVPARDIHKTVSELINRALSHEIGKPDEINISVERLKQKKIKKLKAMDIATILVDDYKEGRLCASKLLELVGVEKKTIKRAMDYMAKGASPDKKNMRGAMIIDYKTGKRIEPDKYRGIRASRMDMAKTAESKLIKELKKQGINNQYIREAIVLSTKVANAPDTIAELCWSDDPSYQAGYAASRKFGYVRFPYLKEKGSPFGGRAFFVDAKKIDLEKYVNFLEQQAVLIIKIGRCKPQITWNTFLESLNV